MKQDILELIAAAETAAKDNGSDYIVAMAARGREYLNKLEFDKNMMDIIAPAHRMAMDVCMERMKVLEGRNDKLTIERDRLRAAWERIVTADQSVSIDDGAERYAAVVHRAVQETRKSLSQSTSAEVKP